MERLLAYIKEKNVKFSLIGSYLFVFSKNGLDFIRINFCEEKYGVFLFQCKYFHDLYKTYVYNYEYLVNIVIRNFVS